MHTTETVDTQNPSVRCSFKESSHGQSFDSFISQQQQTNKPTESHYQPLNQVETKTSDSKASCSLEMGLCFCCLLFLFLFSFLVPSLCTTCFGHYRNYLESIAFPTKCVPWLQRHKALKDNSCVISPNFGI